MMVRYALSGAILLSQLALALPGIAEEPRDGSKPMFSLPESKRNCVLCHVSPDVRPGAAALKQPVPELCFGCHADRRSPNEHKIDIAVPVNAGRLPLHQGKMTCTTCHDPHKNLYGSLLRLHEPDLCSTCHPY
jgi:predicted CXXCH cytochrome family protein